MKLKRFKKKSKYNSEKYEKILDGFNDLKKEIISDIHHIYVDKFVDMPITPLRNTSSVDGELVTNIEKKEKGNIEVLLNSDSIFSLQEITFFELVDLYLLLCEMEIDYYFFDALELGNEHIMSKLYDKYHDEINLDDLEGSTIFELLENADDAGEFFVNFHFQKWVLETHPEKTSWFLSKIEEYAIEIDERIKEKYGHLIDGSRFNL